MLRGHPLPLLRAEEARHPRRPQTVETEAPQKLLCPGQAYVGVRLEAQGPRGEAGGEEED